MKTIPHIITLLLFLIAGQTIADELQGLRATIDERLAAEWGAENCEWVEMTMPDARLLQGGDGWTLDVPEKPRGRVVLYANVHEENAILRRIPFRIRVMPFAWVPVLAQPLQHNAPVNAAQIRWERREVTDIRHPWPDEPGMLQDASYRLRRALQAGDILTWQDLEAIPMVCQGNRVALRLKQGSVLVETEGIAMQDGHIGEIIRVEQEELGSLLRAKVTGTGRADIINALGR